MKHSTHITNPHPPDDAVCYICGGRNFLQTHEIFGGSSRNLSIRYGLQVYLCWNDHQGTRGVHGRDGKELMNRLHREGQMRFEGRSGTRQEFVSLFGKSYMEDEDEQQD